MSQDPAKTTDTPAPLDEAFLGRIEAVGLAAACAERRGPFGVAGPAGALGHVAAVDRFGQRSLFYRVDEGGLRIACRADALARPDEPLEAQSLYDYLYFHDIPSPRSVFRDIKRLPPGHCLTARSGELTVQPYWRARFEPLSSPSFDELKQRFRHALRDAVADCLAGQPDDQAACFLSGGTDSSTLAGVIREVTGQPAECYSIGFDAAGYDEMRYARLAARHFDARHHEYYVTPDDLVRTIPQLARFLDQPFGNSSLLPAHLCALRARSDGFSLMLAGDGGDELFGGNSRYALQKVLGVYQNVPRWLRQGMLEPLFGLGPVSKLPLLRKGSGYIRQATTPMPDRLADHNLLLRIGAGQMLEQAFLSKVDTGDPMRQQREIWQASDAHSELDRTLAFDWRYTLAESDLPKVRYATQMAGVDVAYPLLHESLLELALQLPASYKLRGLKLRWFFKEALRGFLPDEILTKSKHGFGLPFGVWALQHQPLRELAFDAVHGLAARGLARKDFARELTTELLAQHPGYYGEMVWIMMMLELWLREHAPAWRPDASENSR